MAKPTDAIVTQPTATSFQEWHRHVVGRERFENSLSNAEIKVVVAQLNLHFAGQMAKYLDANETCTSNLHTDGFDANVTVQKKCSLVRVGEGATYMPLWSKVVTEDVARRLARATTADLGDSNGMGPRLFLDGSGYTNIASSSIRLGWMVPPVP